ncbi:MAG TPA: hypothetical protein PLP73_03150, partial [Candidatus Absconditabacterales bacterium]|nr:hypothetical protein [Candidatus Absconditabacterales bacterium]
MKTDGKKIVEDENLNNNQEQTKEDRETKFKKLQSDSERGVQKIINEKKEVETFLDRYENAISTVSADNSKLVDIYDNDPKVAERILSKFYGGMSIDEFVDEYLDGKRPAKKVDYDKLKEKAKAEARKEIEAEEANSYLQSKLKKFTSEEQELILEEREDFV